MQDGFWHSPRGSTSRRGHLSGGLDGQHLWIPALPSPWLGGDILCHLLDTARGQVIIGNAFAEHALVQAVWRKACSANAPGFINHPPAVSRKWGHLPAWPSAFHRLGSSRIYRHRPSEPLDRWPRPLVDPPGLCYQGPSHSARATVHAWINTTFMSSSDFIVINPHTATFRGCLCFFLYIHTLPCLHVLRCHSLQCKLFWLAPKCIIKHYCVEHCIWIKRFQFIFPEKA